MKLVTIATKNERYYPYLKLSAERNGYELVTLGWGEKWQGFVWKFEIMKEYLRSLNENEIVCFVDGYDVIILQDVNVLEKNFNDITFGDKSKIVLALEKETDSYLGNLITSTWTNFFSYKCNNKLINSGTYIGYSSTLLDTFNSICKEFECKHDSDDQVLLQKYCAKRSDRFIFDTESNLFLTMPDLMKPISSNTNDIVIENKILTFKVNIKPCIFHAPAFTDIDDLIKDLGYDTTIFKARNESKLNYQLGFAKHYIKEIFLRYWIYIIVIVFIVVYIILNRYFNINSRIYRVLKRKSLKG
jgi:hypothetical protein